MTTLNELVDAKLKALDMLYKRIEQVAESMGGQSARRTVERRIPAVLTSSPASGTAPGLTVMMPGSFRVELGPSNALNVGNGLSVQAKRFFDGVETTEMGFRWDTQTGAWLFNEVPLTDEAFRACLTMTGPPPIRY